MNLLQLIDLVASGEDGTRQFKSDIRNTESIDVSRINQLISNAASNLVRSPLTVQTENLLLENRNVVIVLTVPKGIDKPYFDKNGVIWLKCGADKRRVNTKEELRRLFQISNQFHADELPAKAGIEALDKLRFRDFLKKTYQQDYPDTNEELKKLLQNMNLATGTGALNLACVLLFAERPEWIVPQFVVKAVRFPGNEIHQSEYLDIEDFTGALGAIFEGAMAFLMRNMHKVQAGRGINAPGTPEIPPIVFEELLVNALMHRDYFVSAPIRLFLFDNRIEIISPGHLPNNLTVAKIKTGNSNIRNPILVSYVAKGLLPYRGLGSGIKRAIDAWPNIDFIDDHDGCLFTAIVHHNKIEGSVEGSVEIDNPVLEQFRLDPEMTLHALAKTLGISLRATEKRVANLQEKNKLKRIGPKKGGYWQVL